MLAPGTPMFILLPDQAEKSILRPGKVLASDATHFEALFEENITPAIGADAVAYAEFRGKFLQQGCQVIEARPGVGCTTWYFQRVGEPVSAEKRQIFRVSTVTAGIVARIAAEAKCPVMDISPEGFSAIVAGQYKVGSTISILLQHQGQLIDASVRVQTVKPRYAGKSRCGFLAAHKTGDARKNLRLLSGELQRAQLRRLSGAA